MLRSCLALTLTLLVIACTDHHKSRALTGKLYFNKDTLYLKTKGFGVTDTVWLTCYNSGLGPLKIIRAEGSCGCTAISTDSSVILPGKSIKAIISYKHTGDTSSVTKDVVFLTTGTPEFKVLYLKTYN